MEKIISVKNLRKVYKKETAVQNVCFELTPGNIMGLLGTNGAGKTTTLKMLTNLCSKDNGKIVIDNVSLDENPGLALCKCREESEKYIKLQNNGIKEQDIILLLREYKKLVDNGIITQAGFDIKKKELLKNPG